MTQKRPLSYGCPAKKFGSYHEGFGGPSKKFKGNGEEVDINKFLTKKLPGRWSGM